MVEAELLIVYRLFFSYYRNPPLRDKRRKGEEVGIGHLD